LINRLTIKENILFKNLTLEFDEKLVVFTGSSGSGKSVLMENILTLFGYKDSQSQSIEASLTTPLELEEFGLENEDENIFKLSRQKNNRYFLNGSQMSKKNILSISKQCINYLNLREFSEFESSNLLNLLDSIILKTNPKYKTTLEDFKTIYKEFIKVQQELKEIEESQKKIEDLKEFAKFEIEKIESINPKVDEYDTLIKQKKELSRKEKIEESLENANIIFDIESKVTTALSQLEVESDFFTESINSLNIIFEEAKDRLSDLEDLDIESLLNRLEDLSSLKNRFGSIEESLIYLQTKKDELLKYENISYEKQELQNKIKELELSITKLSNTFTKHRKIALDTLNKDINHYTTILFLDKILFKLSDTTLHSQGSDEITLTLGSTTLLKVSSGELNRIRLSFIATASRYIQKSGVLILDEIDANLSGKESMSVAKVLQELSKNYQIFAISHQPQLSSFADEHFLVYKQDNQAYVKKLSDDERVTELSRMISGEKITDEARNFAKKMLEENR